ncbi:hypothetical protein SADUNF_Sadunf12G0015900 [Salix dunnii]|uniref:Uncharacterized protein n=1 Tax=Salix dunnii TaxID=1413687 RepID=A0A835MP11_9ROSI|nr:hypothetical protein SADUNF_Sadunf12G0015900 [Salix dunnii]
MYAFSASLIAGLDLMFVVCPSFGLEFIFLFVFGLVSMMGKLSASADHMVFDMLPLHLPRFVNRMLQAPFI